MDYLDTAIGRQVRTGGMGVSSGYYFFDLKLDPDIF
jgi:hypothetical protein